MRKNLFALVALLALTAPAFGVTLPYTFSGNVPPSQVNANFSAVRDAINQHEAKKNGHNTSLADVLAVGNSAGLAGIDFNLTEGKNLKVENVTADPSCAASSEGRLIWNKTEKLYKVCNGTTFVSIAGTGVNTLSSVLQAGNSAGSRNLDLNGNQLLTARIENMVSDPSAGQLGRLIFNTTQGVLKVDTGSSFQTVGGAQGLASVLGQSNSAGAYNVNFNGNQALNLVGEKLASNPGTTNAGRLYYNTSANAFRFFNGSSWLEIGNTNPLSSVLALGNSVGAFDLDLNGHQLLNALLHRSSSAPSTGVAGQVWFNTTSDQAQVGTAAGNQTIATTGQAQTLTNKTISGASNTITNVPDSALSPNVGKNNQAQTITGKKTFSTAPVVSKVATPSGAEHSLTDGLADDTITLNKAAQELEGKTLKSPILSGNLDFNNFQAVKARVENLPSNPGSPQQGRVYFNTNTGELRYWAGSEWLVIATNKSNGGLTYDDLSAVLPLTYNSLGQFSILQSSLSEDGFLAATDFANFAAKLTSPLTQKGDLLGFDGSAHCAIPVGSPGQLLTVDPVEACGFKWAAAPVSLPTQTGQNGKFLTTDGSAASWADIPTAGITSLNGDVAGTGPGATAATIQPNAVTTGKINDGAVTNAKLADNSAGTSKIQDGAITTDKIADANVTAAKLADSSVATGKLQDASVTAQKIAAGAVPATLTKVTQNGHGFSVGQPLKIVSSTTYGLAQGDSDANAEVVGLVANVIDGNNFILNTGGYIAGLNALTPGAVYRLSPDTAGALIESTPSVIGQIDKPVLVAETATSGFIIHSRGMVVARQPLQSPAEVKGDLIGFNGSSATRVPVGTDGQILTADSTNANGVSFKAAPVSLPSQTGNNGKFLMSNQGVAAWQRTDDPNLIQNVSFSVATASNALTINLRDSQGSNHSASNLGRVAFRNQVVPGIYTVAPIDSTQSITVPQGAKLGMRSFKEQPLYVYFVLNGNPALAVSAMPLDESKLYATSALSSSSDTANALYVASGNESASQMPIRLLGVIRVTEAVAGNYTNSNYYDFAMGTGALRTQAAQVNLWPTEWRDYPMVISSTGTAPTKPTNLLVDKAQWRRSGPDTIDIRYNYSAPASPAGAANGTGDYLFAVPTQFTVDLNKLPVGSGALAYSGGGRVTDAGNNSILALMFQNATQWKAFGKWSGNGASGATVNDFAVSGPVYGLANPNMAYGFLLEGIPVTQYAGALAGTIITKDPETKFSGLLTTKVTGRDPNAIGEYRYLNRAASSASSYSDSGALPILPTAANGIPLWKGGGYSTADSLPSRLDVFIGTNKAYAVRAWAQSSGVKGDALDITPFTVGGSYDVGWSTIYDSNTGILSFVRFNDTSNTSTHWLGRARIGGMSGANYALLEISTYDNPTAAGISPSKDELTLWGYTGYGSTGTTTVRFTSQQAYLGDALQWVQDSVNGDYILVKKDGQYSYSQNVYSSNAQYVGVTVDSTSTSTPIQNLNYTQGNRGFVSQGNGAGQANMPGNSRLLSLVAGQKIRLQSQGSAMDLGAVFVQFSVTRVASPFENVGTGGTGNVRSTSGPRIEWAKFDAGCSSGTCSPTSGFAGLKMQWNSLGNYSIVPDAGVFGGHFSCQVTGFVGGQNAAFDYVGSTTTLWSFLVRGSAQFNFSQADVQCMGPTGTN